MGNKITICILILTFVLFALYETLIQNRPHVLGIVTPTMIQVDLNGNSIVDDGETLCLPDIESFTSDLKLSSRELADRMDIPYEKSLAIGFLADDFANKTLSGKTVKVKFAGKTKNKPHCRNAVIYVNNQNYGNLLLQSGFGIKTDFNKNSEGLRNWLAAAEKLKLVILNHKSLKYHTLDCKYGQAANDSVILPEKEIPADAQPCKFCHIEAEKLSTRGSQKIIPPPPCMITDGNIKLILTDFTTVLKPDRDCNNAVCREFVNCIESAQHTIDMAMYGWTNVPKVNAALESAQKRGVKIRIIYDKATNGQNHYPETDDFVSKYPERRSDEIPGQTKLTNMIMHNKFAVFDDSRVFTGSMNFSATGFSGFNHNNVIIINSADVAEVYEREFDQMFEGKFHTLKKKSMHNSNLQCGSTLISVYFSPQDKALTQAVIPLIKNSKKYIYVPAFLFTHKSLSTELINAKKRGVDVKMIIDATNTHGEHSVFKKLRSGEVPVKVENYAGKMHAKAMIIDDEYLIFGSTNFSDSGENKNDENLLIIKNPRLTRLYKEYFEYFWSKIPDKYLKYTVKAESKYSIGSCSDGIDNDFDGKIDMEDEGCR